MVGSGAGGGVLARRLAAGGTRVLLIERGEATANRGIDEGWDERPVRLNGRWRRIYAGSGLGGSTALYGGALLRPSPRDFRPGRDYRHRLPAAVWEWPVDYEELRPYYRAVEDDLRVAGDHEPAPPHIGWREGPFPQSAAELSAPNRHLADALRREGLHPFSLPLAIERSRCHGCARCPGMLCPTGARATSLAGRRVPLATWTGWEAVELAHAGRVVHGVWVRRRGHRGPCRLVRAERYVLAAGAIGSAVLLERSQIPDRSGQRGRNHMCHLGALALGVFPERVVGDEGFAKQLGVTDYYWGAGAGECKLGYAQTIPLPELGPGRFSAALAPRAAVLRRRTLLLAGSVEDLPDPRNRVRVGDDGVYLDRRFRRFDRGRARRFARRLRATVRAVGAQLVLAHSATRAHHHLGHQVGTCRFGDDPRYAVLDRDCRVHGIDNLYVVDGSFMPTSLGVGPALTIMANAARVADHLLGSRP